MRTCTSLHLHRSPSWRAPLYLRGPWPPRHSRGPRPATRYDATRPASRAARVPIAARSPGAQETGGCKEATYLRHQTTATPLKRGAAGWKGDRSGRGEGPAGTRGVSAMEGAISAPGPHNVSLCNSSDTRSVPGPCTPVNGTETSGDRGSEH